MASGDGNFVALSNSPLLYDDITPTLKSSVDENSPPSPGEIRMMRNHPKVASVLFSPVRKSLSATEERKIKPKSFARSIYMSPKEKTKLLPTDKRKTLQVLQPTASGDGTLVGSHGLVRCASERKSKSKSAPLRLKQQKLKVAESSTSPACTDSSDSSDAAANSVTKDTKSSTGVEEDIIGMMVSDPPPERYWELLAEERRLALRDALEENERLYKELEEMKKKNNALEEIAGQAEYFASLYQMVMEGEIPDVESSDDTNEDPLITGQT